MTGFGMNNAVTGFVNNTQTWQDSMKQQKSIESSAQRNNDSKTAFQNSLNTTNTDLQNKYNSMCNAINLSEAIVLAAQSHGVHDYDNLEPSDITNRFLEKNKSKGYETYVNDCLAGKITLGDAVSKMKLDVLPKSNNIDTQKKRINPLNVQIEGGMSEGGSNAAVNTIIGAGSALGGTALAEGTYYGGKLSKGIGKSRQEMLYKPTDEQKSYKQYINAKIIEANDNLKKAKNTGDEKAIQEATEALKGAKMRKNTLRTVADTAYEYGIGNPFNLSITNSKEGDLAKARADEIFTDVLNPIFESSDAKINVMDRIEELRDLIPTMTTDEGRREGLTKARAALLDEYRKKGWDSVSLKDVQQLKSDLQKRVPEKVWEGKPIANEYAELKAELSKLIRKDLINEIENAIKEGKAPDLKGTRYEGKTIEELYRDWGNLEEISNRSLKYKMPSIEIPGIGKIEGDVVTPAQKGAAFTLRKIGDAIDNSWFGKAMNKLNKSFGKLMKNKKVLGGLTAIGTLGSFADALELTKGADFFGKYGSDLYRITERYNKFGEFAGKTDEEIEEMFPESEVLDILKAIDNDEEVASYFDYFNEDLFGRKKVDMNKYWDYVGGKLKNNDEPKEEPKEESELEKNIKKLKKEKGIQ